MNFEEWFKKDRIVTFCNWSTKNDYQIGWNACKKEILKVLRDRKTRYFTEDDYGITYLEKDNLEREIKKL